MEPESSLGDHTPLDDQQYRRLFDHTMVGLYRTTPEGEILECNEAFAGIYGYGSAAQVLEDEAWTHYRTPDDREAFLAELQDSGQVKNFEQQRLRRDGRPVWVLENATLTQDPATGNDVIAGTVLDITDRKEADRGRRATEQRYRLLFERNVAGVYRSTPDGEVLEANQAWLDMLGFESTDAISDAQSLYQDPADRQRWIDALREKGQLTNYEMPLVGADGSPLWILENSTLADDPEAGEVILGVAIDVTEERLLERRYRQIVEENVVGVYRSKPEGQMLECNEALAEMLGYDSPDAALADQVWSHFPDRGSREEFLATLRDTGSVRNYEQLYRRRDGSEFWALENASLARDLEGEGEIIIGTVLDITRQKRAEQALRAAEQRYRLLFERNVAGVYRSTPEGEILEVNDAFLEMLGYDSLESFEEHVASGAHQIYMDASHRERWMEALREEGALTNWEVQLQKKDGSPLWVLENSTLADDPEAGEVILGVAIDVTEERLLERRYRQIVEENVAGVYRSRPEGGMLECNQALVDMFGYASVEEALGDQAWSHFPDREKREAFLSDLREQGRVRNYEMEYRRQDGSRFWALENASLADDPEGDGEIIIGTVLDITQQKRAEEARRATEQRYRLLFERNVAGVYRTTPEGEVLEVNDAFLEMLGYSSLEAFEEHVASGAHELYMDPSHRERWVEALREEGALTNWEVRIQKKDGSPLWVLENSTLTEDPETGEEIIIGTVTDITEQKRLEQELERLAFRDPLTGLANRRMLRNQVQRAMAEADRRGDRVGLLYMDLARFKRINDTLGHEAGDRVLVDVAKRVGTHLRASDLAARMGGDEFAVLLTELGEVKNAMIAAERLAEEMEDPVALESQHIQVDADIGVAVYPDHGSNFDELLRNADRTMYRAKNSKDTSVEIYETEDGLPRHDDAAVQRALWEALEKEQFTLHYQPVERLAEDRIIGVEALLRWEHPERGLLRAAEFVPLAEKLGIMGDLDRWVLAAAVKRARRWAEGDGPGPRWVAVNLSSQLLNDPELPGYVDELMDQETLEEPGLIVEITERSALRDVDRAAQILQELSELGVKTAIDDFGTGHSLLAYLKHFPTDLLKIDAVFVQGLSESRKDRQLVEAIVRLARDMGIEVVAKGIEEREQYDWIKKAGCDCAQGYYLSEPMPPEELEFGS